MKNSKQHKSWLFKNITVLTSFFIISIILISVLIVYYWSFHHFSNIFEDRIIDQYTLEKSDDLGVKNEWILGVTTDSIDVLEAIHGREVTNHIISQAESQEEIRKLYKEKIGGKHLIYIIELDTQNGEFIYKYSVIKDIYAEVFPQIAFSFLIFAIALFIISFIYSKFLSDQLYTNINRLIDYIKEFSPNISINPISLDTGDNQIEELAYAFNEMKKRLNEKEALQQSTLEYISHEMKTPIMIIESYATSARDQIFPKGDLDASLDTIISQTKRMKEKVDTLMTISRITSPLLNEGDYQDIHLLTLIRHIIIDLGERFKGKTVKLYLKDDLTLYGDFDKIQILLENLIENQVKYSVEFISIRAFMKGDTTILLFYNDGAMIQESIEADLFKPFIKGSNGANGLGLSICKTITTQHGGEILKLPTIKGTLFKVKI